MILLKTIMKQSMLMCYKQPSNLMYLIYKLKDRIDKLDIIITEDDQIHKLTSLSR